VALKLLTPVYSREADSNSGKSEAIGRRFSTLMYLGITGELVSLT